MVWCHKTVEEHILPLMLPVVLQSKGEVVHYLQFFEGYTVEDWLSAAVQIVVRGNMDDLVGSYRAVEPVLGKAGLHIWWC